MSAIYLLKFHVMGGLVVWQSLLQVQDRLSLAFISLMWTFLSSRPPTVLFCFVWYDTDFGFVNSETIFYKLVRHVT